MPRPRASIYGMHLSIAAAIIAADQMSKALVRRSVPLHDSIPVIPGFFSISHVLNPGAAFSLFADAHPGLARWGLVLFSILVIAIVAVVLWRLAAGFSRNSFALALILGGAIGNLIDRLRVGSVVDFLAFDFGRYHWPDFNLADSAIVIGSCLLILDALLSSNKSETSSVDAR